MKNEEIWKEYPKNTRILVSSLGRVKRKCYMVTFEKFSKNGTPFTCTVIRKERFLKASKLLNKGKAGNTEYLTASGVGLIHRAMAEAFLPNPNRSKPQRW